MHVLDNRYGRFVGVFREGEGKGGAGGEGGGEGGGGGTKAGEGGEGGAKGGEGGEGGGTGGEGAGGKKAGGEGTILDGGAKEGTVPAGKFPDNWRNEMAMGDDGKVDADHLKLLERYDSPKAAARALREAQNKIRSGQVKTPLPENATTEQVAAYRKEQGIPETAEGYEKTIKLRDGLVIGEADKPMVASVLADFHKENATPAEVNRALNAYYKLNEQVATQRKEADAGFLREANDVMRDEWGGDFRINQRVLREYIKDEGLEALEGARDATGRLILTIPKVISHLTNLARDKNPIATVVPNDGGKGGLAAQTELKKLDDMMKDPESAYNKGPERHALQARYRDLVDADLRQKERAGVKR